MIVKRKIALLSLWMASIISLAACGNSTTSLSSAATDPEKSQTTTEQTDSTTSLPESSSSPSSQDADIDAESSDTEKTDEAVENKDSGTPEISAGTWDLKIDTVTLDNMPITEEEFKDNVLTVLNIWGTWCPPCVEELPELQEVSERFKDKNVQIVGVLEDGIIDVGIPDNDIINSAKILTADADAEYLMILPDETLMTQFINDLQAFPTTFFLDSKGEVIHTAVGAMDADTWEMVINDVLKEISN